MKFPVSWVKEFVELPAGITSAELENALVKVGFEVEEIIESGADLTGPLVVGKVESIKELEGLKKPIRYVGLDCGEGEIRYVICGARNFEVGDHIVAALPGAVLPGNFVISARETYSHTSNGMICSGRELGISNDHNGIINLPKSTKIGADAISLLEINDTIIDIAVNPDRGYALSIRGIARELAASLGVKFKDPVLQTTPSKYPDGDTGIKVSIDDLTGASDIYIRTINNFNLNAEVPIWFSRRIEKCGMRSISLAVDITNYVMLELGQPLHAFDADKIQGGLHIRRAGAVQKFTTLDGVERELQPDNLVVADDKAPLALAGTMGGLTSEISDTTVRIALEGAHFEPIAVAKNSRAHKLSSEASRRLERGVDPKLAELATSRAVDLLIELGGANYLSTSKVISPAQPVVISLDPKFVGNYLGAEVSESEVAEKLTLVGCEISKGDLWQVTVPSWRPDLTMPVELVEEVARLIGYDRIPLRLPLGKNGARLTTFQNRKRELAKYLANIGFTETYNFPFTNKEILEKLGITGARAQGYVIANPMSEELPMFRTHILPGLLETANRNRNRGNSSLAIFEIGSIARGDLPPAPPSNLSTDKRPTDAELEKIYNSIPKQMTMLAAIVTDSLESKGWWGKGELFTWSDAISLTADLLDLMNVEYELVASNFAPWHPGRCAEFKVAGRPIAHAGELHPKVAQLYNLPVGATAFGILISELPDAVIPQSKPIITLPAAIQDVSLLIPAGITALAVENSLRIGAGEALESIELFDRYQNQETGEVSLAFTLKFRSSEKTLTSEEASAYREAAVAKAVADHGVVLRG
jgi:phenylalanyl-tRNA synthetase beta chain